MTSIRASKVLCSTAITLLVLAVVNVLVVAGGWPVSRNVAGYGLMVLGAGVFALLYRVEPESFRPQEGRKLVFWSVACGIVLLGAGGGLIASVLKPHGVLLLVTLLGLVAIGAVVGTVIEPHLGDRNGEAFAQTHNAV
jgi:MFS family permease